MKQNLILICCYSCHLKCKYFVVWGFLLFLLILFLPSAAAGICFYFSVTSGLEFYFVLIRNKVGKWESGNISTKWIISTVRKVIPLKGIENHQIRWKIFQTSYGSGFRIRLWFQICKRFQSIVVRILQKWPRVMTQKQTSDSRLGGLVID